MDNINIQRVLIAPLDWGLGHATRSIPIIKSFQALNIDVLIAAEGACAALLSKEFPTIRIIPLNGYRIAYAKTAIGLIGKLIQQVPKILRIIKREHLWLEKIIQVEKIDLVISDNRYGLYTKQIPCVFITHQLTIKTPFEFIERLIQKINYRFINRFSACWVPDAASEINIAGLLSHPSQMPETPVSYLGIVSRMEQKETPETQFDYCFLISGPEPQRTILEEQILKCLPKLEGSIVLVRGLPSVNIAIAVPDNTIVYNHLSTNELESILSASELIICRSGYTSIMELVGLKKNALLIPTPGQTEQVYLAENLYTDRRFYMADQKNLNLLDAINKAKNYERNLTEIQFFTTKTLEALLVAL